MSQPDGFTGRALRAVKWNYIGTVGRIVATLLSQLLLARWLGPETFGVFGYAFLVVSLAALVVDLGLAKGALIQAPDLTNDLIRTSMGRIVLASVVASAAIYLLSDVIAVDVFRRADAGPVIAAMAPSLLFTAVAAAASAVLTREIEFRTVQISGLVAYVLGYLVVGFAAALSGLGVWSLVLAWYVFSLMSCAALIWYSPRNLWPSSPFGKLPIAGFGYVVMATNFVNWFIDNAAHVIIGRSIGATGLGQFTVANNLLRVPADNLVRNFQAVLLPLSARAQGRDDGLRRAYLTVVAGSAAIVFPMFAFVAAMAHPVVVVLLGERWLSTEVLMVPLSMAMIAHAVEAPVGPMLAGLGLPRVELRTKLLTLVAMVGSLALAAHFGSIAHVAWALAGLYVLRLVLMHTALARRLSISLGAYGRTLAGPAVLGLAAGAVAMSIGAWIGESARVATSVVSLTIGAAGVAAACVALVLLFPRAVIGPQLLQLLSHLAETRPGLLRVPGLRRILSAAAA
jgi:O-antigen/teichoic acid export membrane protein